MGVQGTPRPRESSTIAPFYNSDGTFNGHTTLVVSPAGRMIDATVLAVLRGAADGSGYAATPGAAACLRQPGPSRSASYACIRPRQTAVPRAAAVRVAEPGTRSRIDEFGQVNANLAGSPLRPMS